MSYHKIEFDVVSMHTGACGGSPEGIGTAELADQWRATGAAGNLGRRSAQFPIDWWSSLHGLIDGRHERSQAGAAVRTDRMGQRKLAGSD